MLKKVNEKQNIRLSTDEIPHVRIADANFPAPFRSGLEYSSPARGTWNIVHTGMLIPEAHEIFVCAAGQPLPSVVSPAHNRRTVAVAGTTIGSVPWGKSAFGSAVDWSG